MIETPQNKLSMHLNQSEKIMRKDDEAREKSKALIAASKKASFHNEEILNEISESIVHQSVVKEKYESQSRNKFTPNKGMELAIQSDTFEEMEAPIPLEKINLVQKSA
jgi:hypothetical protein